MQNINNIKALVVAQTTNTLINALYTETSKTLTKNGAVTFSRTESALLDFYAQAGAMRETPEKALELFKKAFSEDNLKAVKILFYLRDVRGGQGERKLFRECLQWLGTDYPFIFNNIVQFVPEYGRWDDMFFDNVKCFELISRQLTEDKQSQKPSLLAKWIPTINSSSKNTKEKAIFMAKNLNMDLISYRKLIRDIRKKIATVEEKMSTNNWEEINYSSVPSQANRIYKNAFKKHDEARYADFIDKAQKGEIKINTGTLYPYQIYKSAQNDYSPTLDALWKQLPDYTQNKNALVVADVSGSMSGDPMAVSVSLALYFAERNKGSFNNYFMTFSQNPVLQRIQGNTLKEKMNSIGSSQWDMNTNLNKVFEVLLKTATLNSVTKDDMPETIYIISDMEFDSCCSNFTSYELIKNQYEVSGYNMPKVVFWNVNASGKNLPTQAHVNGVSLVSGFSPVIFKMAVENKTPYEVMLDTINNKRYEKIRI